MHKFKFRILFFSLVFFPITILLGIWQINRADEKGIQLRTRINERICNLLKKNGLMFTATINRTLTSYIKAIIGAEYILRWLPIGTHDWNKFIKPEELEKFLSQEKFSTLDIKGLKFNPFLKKWSKSKYLSVNLFP